MDPYDTTELLKALIRRLETSKDENDSILLDFAKDLQLKGIGNRRILKYIYVLRGLGKEYNLNFKGLTDNDNKAAILQIDSSNLKDWSKHDKKVMLRLFCTWMNGKYGKKLDFSWLKITSRTLKKLPEELITEEEFQRLLSACNNLRDMALLYVLYESGCRIGEILTLQIKHITFDELGAVLIVNGKTGQRRVRIFNSKSYLSNYLDVHPFRKDPESYLWLTRFSRKKEEGSKYTHLTYPGVQKLFEELASKTSLSKRFHPHILRHSRATQLAKVLTEAQLKQVLGWTQGSNMASIYVHLSGRDTDDALLKAYGLKKDELEKPKVIFCSKCREPNSQMSDRCRRCGYPLKEEELLKIDRRDEVVFEFLKVISDEIPGIKDRFKRIVREKNAEELFK